MRGRRPGFAVFVFVLLVAGVVALAFYLLGGAPPRAARLLPEADGAIYVDLRPLRFSGLFSEAAAVVREPEYEQFVRETGFQFERDLDQAALAVHFPSPAEGARETRFSEIFMGRWDAARLAAYLRKLAARVEPHGNTEVFLIPHEDRTVRVAILGAGIVAVSNHEDPSMMEAMIDHFRRTAWPYASPAILSANYRRVPIASIAWAILRLPDRRAGRTPGLFGLDNALPAGSVIVASIRYTGSMHLQAEAFTGSAQSARSLAEKAGIFLQLYRAVEKNEPAGGPDADVKRLFDNLRLEEHGDRVILSATITPGLVRKALAGSTAQPAVSSPEPPDRKQPAPRRGRVGKQNPP